MIRIFKEKNTIWSFMIRKQLKNRFSSIGGQDNLKQAIMKDLRNQLREKNEMEEKSNKKTGPLRDEILHSELKSLVSLESNKFLEENYSNDKYVLSKEGKVSLLYAQGCENNGKSRNILDYDPMMSISRDFSLLFCAFASEKKGKPVAFLDSKAHSGIKSLRLIEAFPEKLKSVIVREDYEDMDQFMKINLDLNRFRLEHSQSLLKLCRMKQLDGLIQDLVEGTKYDLIEEDLKFCSRSQLFAMISSIEDGGIIGINFTEMENIISNGSEHKWNYIFGVNRSKNCHNPKEVMIRAFYKDVMDTAKDIEGCIIEPLFVFNEVRISKVYFKVVKGSAGKRNEYTEEAIKTEESNEKDNHLVVQVNCVDCPYYYVVENEEKSGNFESGSFLHCSCPACGGKMELSGL